jgi:16S rRNA (cytidine1402-2'-O)-methyltransferase
MAGENLCYYENMSILYVVATPIGNLTDISPRALTVLRDARYILAEDTRHTGILLRHYGISRPMLAVHKFNEWEKSGSILDKIIHEDCDAALVSDAGTPCVSDPGSTLVGLAHEKNITVIGIPGACALATAVSVCGFDSSRFSFIGFFPKTGKQRAEAIDVIRNSSIELTVIYESPLRVVETLALLREQFPHAECAVSNDLTKLHERTIKGSLADVHSCLESDANARKGEYVIVLKSNAVVEQKPEDALSLEAQLLDYVIKHQVSFKTAIQQLTAQKVSSKSNLYQASLRLREKCS